MSQARDCESRTTYSKGKLLKISSEQDPMHRHPVRTLYIVHTKYYMSSAPNRFDFQNLVGRAERSLAREKANVSVGSLANGEETVSFASLVGLVAERCVFSDLQARARVRIHGGFGMHTLIEPAPAAYFLSDNGPSFFRSHTRSYYSLHFRFKLLYLVACTKCFNRVLSRGVSEKKEMSTSTTIYTQSWLLHLSADSYLSSLPRLIGGIMHA